MIALAVAAALGCSQAAVTAPGSPLVVGDSVTVPAASSLRRRGFGVNARVCRETREGLDVVRRQRPWRLVFALGANGRVSTAQLRQARALTRREVLLVTPGGKDDGDRLRMMRFAWKHDDVRVLDWNRLSRRRGILQPDGLHLTAAGGRAFAAAIDAAVDGPFGRFDI